MENGKMKDSNFNSPTINPCFYEMQGSLPYLEKPTYYTLS
jgi:hypothetical protein